MGSQSVRGPFGSVQLLMAIEEHGAGRQFARFRVAPRCSRPALGAVAACLTLGMTAGWAGVVIVSTLFCTLALLLLLRIGRDSGVAMAAVLKVMRATKREIERREI